MRRSLIIAIVILGLVPFVVFFSFRNRFSLSRVSQDVSALPSALVPSEVAVAEGEEFELRAGFVKKQIAGREARMLAYNGSIPGPVLRVKQGSEIKVRFYNDMDIATTIHSHGVRVDNAFDGVPGVTQKAIQPGESFTYTLKFPDAGVYWYHPHVREDYTQEAGLYGQIIVEPSDSSYWSPVNREEVIALDDILLDSDGLAPFSYDTADHALMGRYGNMMLTNGEESPTLRARAGEVVRYYVVNVANVRPFLFSIRGAKMKLVGGDNGRVQRETFVKSVLLGPSERAIIDVYYPTQGEYELIHTTPNRTYKMGTVVVDAGKDAASFVAQFNALRQVDALVADLAAWQQRTPDKTLRLTVTTSMSGVMGGHGHQGMVALDSLEGIEWEDSMPMMNSQSTPSNVEWKLVDESTKRVNDDIDWQFTVGDFVKIRIKNDINSDHPMQHPIHFHGQRFLVLSENGVLNANPVWKDTVLIPEGTDTDILLEVSNTGEWVAHCHIPEHMEAGMMFQYTVSAS